MAEAQPIAYWSTTGFDKERRDLRRLEIWCLIFAPIIPFGVFAAIASQFVEIYSRGNSLRIHVARLTTPPDVRSVAIMFAETIAIIVLNIVSARKIGQKRWHKFSFIIAVIDCIFIPFGTFIGIWTIIILSRKQIRQLYRSS
jgi:hypothetical protein